MPKIRVSFPNVAPADEAASASTQSNGANPLHSKEMEAFRAAAVTGPKFFNIPIPAKRIIIDDWLLESQLGFIYAYRGVGKTFIVLSLSISIAEGIPLGEWQVTGSWPVLYADGEMSHDETRDRILGMHGGMPTNLTILNHEVLFHQSGMVMDFGKPAHQKLLLNLCLDLKIKVLFLDNLSCLFTGVGENESDEWGKIKPWLLNLRRAGITVILVHHSGHDQTRMRGTSAREDAAAWVMRLDNKKESFDEEGAHFISRFTKCRARKGNLAYQWDFTPAGVNIEVVCRMVDSLEMLLQWVKEGLTTATDIAEEMKISKGRVSQMATKLIQANRLVKNGREYRAL